MSLVKVKCLMNGNEYTFDPKLVHAVGVCYPVQGCNKDVAEITVTTFTCKQPSCGHVETKTTAVVLACDVSKPENELLHKA